jgi:hypothetical protein
MAGRGALRRKGKSKNEMRRGASFKGALCFLGAVC